MLLSTYSTGRTRRDRSVPYASRVKPLFYALPRRALGCASSRSARSSRSFGRPAAFLFLMNCLRPKNRTRCAPSLPISAPDQASRNDTPEIALSKSIRNGSRPSTAIRSPRANCSACAANAEKPKSVSAFCRRTAFAVVASTNTSRSSVFRGIPIAASACAPMITNRTRCKFKHRKRSFQSGGKRTVMGSPQRDLPNELYGLNPLRDGSRQPVAQLTSGRLIGSQKLEVSFRHRRA